MTSLFRESACFRAPASVCQRCLGCVAADARHRFERANWTARSTRNSPKTAREAPLPSGSSISQSCHRAFKVRCAFHSCPPAAAGEYRLSTPSGLPKELSERRKAAARDPSCPTPIAATASVLALARLIQTRRSYRDSVHRAEPMQTSGVARLASPTAWTRHPTPRWDKRTSSTSDRTPSGRVGWPARRC